MSIITRTQNTNGTYRYVVDGAVHTKASKKAYTHASQYLTPAGKTITFLHTREDLAVKGSNDYNRAVRDGHGSRIPGVVIIDIHPEQSAPEPKPTTPKEKPTMPKTDSKPQTCQIKSAPLTLLVRIHQVNGTKLDTPEKGSVHKVTDAGKTLYSVRTKTIKGTEFTPDTKIVFHVSEEDVCQEHNEPKVQRPGGTIRCNGCLRDAAQAKKADGGITRREAKAKAKAERLERVVAEATRRQEKTREQMIGAAVRTASVNLPKQVRGSQARRDGYVRAHLTTMVGGFGVSIEDAANWAGIPAWEPMTWAAFRKDFGKNAEAEAA